MTLIIIGSEKVVILEVMLLFTPLGMSPEEFASREEWGSSNWEKSQKKVATKCLSKMPQPQNNYDLDLILF